MIKKYINRKSFFYKPYLYFRIIWLEKFFFKKKSYSQCGEDLFIENFFKNKNYGTYLDIGAFNPIKFSNTLLLYKKGWKGINIDLNQTSIDLFNIFRPRDKNICAAISNKEEKVRVSIENLFSPLNTISLERSKKLSQNNIKKNLYYVKTKKINNLIKNKFDFLNIDIEGLDFKVLKSIKLNFYKPKLICIEVLDKTITKELIKFLKNYGYIFVKKRGPSFFFKLR
jgi:FkbM family methyltransferase